MTLARHAPRSEIKLRERAYDVFTEQLLRSEIKPGQFVTQRELVALTGQSLGAIRELIPRLEAEGLIVTVPQRGLQILPLDITLIRNAFQFRLILEREARMPAMRQSSGSRRLIMRSSQQHRTALPTGSSPRPRRSTANSMKR